MYYILSMKFLLICAISLAFFLTSYSNDNIPAKVKGGFRRCIVFSEEFEGGRSLTGGKYKSDMATFDLNGKLLEKIRYNPLNDSTKITYRYDLHSNIIEQTTYGSGDAVVEKTIFEYDPQNNVTKEGHILGHDTLTVNLEIVYTENGEIEKITTFKSGKSINSSYTYKYNDAGKKIESVYFYSRKPKNINERTVYKYDDKDSLIETTTYQDGAISFTKTFLYDTHGNLIHVTLNSSDNKQHEEHIFKYDKKGNKIQESLLTVNSMLPLGAYSKNSIYKYDNYGNVLEETSYLSKNPKEPTFKKLYIYSK